MNGRMLPIITSRLRRPNLNPPPPPTGGGVSSLTSSLSAVNDTATESQCVADYTRICHQRLLLNNDIMFDHDNDDNDDDNPSSFKEKNKSKKKNDDTRNKISMERCIAQLEPILDKFRTSCILNDKSRRKKRRQGNIVNNTATGEVEIMNANDKEDDEDEIPPQLTRTARFFPHIFQPIKRALLRPYIISSDVSSTMIQTADDNNGNDDNNNNGLSVELGVYYRLRLAKACTARGLVAVAEYETLRQSIHQAKKVGESTHNADDDHDGDENTTTKRQKTNSTGEDEDEDDDALTERVRLSLLRLPSDAVLSTSTSSSSFRGRTNASWRHVVDTLSTWSIRWKEEEEVRRTIKNDDNESLSSTKLNTHKLCRSSNLVNPDQVADWAMSSWTAILLLQGEMGHHRSTEPAYAGHQQQQHVENDSIEIRLATILSNRHCHDNENSIAANTTIAFEALTHAVKFRIDNLLSPEIIVSLNGIHLYSLGRLLSLFHNRQDAIEHIVMSIIKCSSRAMATSTSDKGGGGGGGGGGLNLFVGMEQLSRLLAVYVSCCCATSSTTTTTTSMLTSSSSYVASDIERDLRTKLDNDEVVRTILLEDQSMKEGNHVVDNSKTQTGRSPPPSSATIQSIKSRAKSFLQLVLCATAHLVGGCCKQ